MCTGHTHRQTLPSPVPCHLYDKRLATFPAGIAGGLVNDTASSVMYTGSYTPSIPQCSAARVRQRHRKRCHLGKTCPVTGDGGHSVAQRGSALSPRPHFHLSPPVPKLAQTTHLSEPWGWSVGAPPPQRAHALGTQPRIVSRRVPPLQEPHSAV